MNVDIGYLPKSYYDEKPDAGGHFPFALEGNTAYVFSLSGFYLPKCYDNLLPSWMENIKGFPVYFCCEIPSYWKEDYEKVCRDHAIAYKYLFH